MYPRLTRRLRLFPAIAFLTVPAFCASINVTTSITPTSLPEPDQTLTESSGCQSITLGTSQPSTIPTIGSFDSSFATGGPTLTFTFNVNVFSAADTGCASKLSTVQFAGTFTPGPDTLTLAGTGTDVVGGATYATVTVAGTTYAVLQSLNANYGKGSPVTGFAYPAVPEPGVEPLFGLGLALVGAVAWRRRQNRPFVSN